MQRHTPCFGPWTDCVTQWTESVAELSKVQNHYGWEGTRHWRYAEGRPSLGLSVLLSVRTRIPHWPRWARGQFDKKEWRVDVKKIAISALNTEPNDPCTITRVSLMPIVVDCIAHIDSHRLSEYEIFVDAVDCTGYNYQLSVDLQLLLDRNCFQCELSL